MSSERAGQIAVRTATAADRPEIEALIAEMIPGCDVAARWRWMYETNPGGKAITWLAVAPTGEVAACTSFFPFRMWLDGEEVRVALGGDGYTRPAFRRRGIGGLLHDTSRREMPAHRIGCMYGAPGAMNVTPIKHGGARELGHVARWARPLGGRALGVRSAPLDRAIAFALRPHRTAELEPMTPHDPRVDAVWAEARRKLRLAAVRDAAFYTWRFLEVPGRAATPYVIVSRGRPIGACALETETAGAGVRIVDLVTVPGAWHAGLRAIVRFCADETAAASVDIKLFALDGRRRQMWRAGFVEREGKPFICMIPRDGDRRFIDPQRWFYTGADSDIERQT
jgi:GNAT superfamily N-acetyltransferase